MTATPLPIDGELFQQAWYVDDIDRAITEWDRVFGAGPFVTSPHHRCDRFDHRGSPDQADVTYAFGYLGDTMIQFITQHDDTPSIYTEMYPDLVARAGAGADGPVGTGFHHTGFLVHDFEAEFERLQSLGFECATRLYADRVDAAYFDTRSVTGGYTEIHGDPPHILDAFATWKSAHESRTPDTPPHLPR